MSGGVRARSLNSWVRMIRRVLLIGPAAAVLALAVAQQATPRGAALTALFGMVLIALSYRDLRDRLIPNALVYPSIAGALVLAPLWPDRGLASALQGSVIAGTLMGATFVASRGGLGAGDVKMAALVGAIVGYPAALTALVIAGVAGAIWSLFVLVTARGRSIPFAPVLAVGAAAVLLRFA